MEIVHCFWFILRQSKLFRCNDLLRYAIALSHNQPTSPPNHPHFGDKAIACLSSQTLKLIGAIVSCGYLITDRVFSLKPRQVAGGNCRQDDQFS